MTRESTSGQAGYIVVYQRGAEGWQALPRDAKPFPSRDTRYKAHYRDPDGRIRSKRFARKADANRWISDQVSAVNSGTFRDPNAGKEKFGGFFTAFLDSAEKRGDLRPATVALYRGVGEQHVLPTFRATELRNISGPAIRKWTGDLLEQGVGRRTVELSHQAMSRVLRQAVEDEILIRNPASGTRLKAQGKSTGGEAPIGAPELWRIAEALREPWDGRYRTLVLLLGYCGLRIGEASGLAETDLNLLKGTLTVRKAVAEVGGRAYYGEPKTGLSERTLTLPGLVKEILSDHIEANPPREVEIEGLDGGTEKVRLVFTGPKGGVLRRTTFRTHVWVPTLTSLELATLRKVDGKEHYEGPKVHDLRGTAASIAIDSGASVLQVSKMLGHADATTTLNRYARLFASRETELADKIDAAARKSLATTLLPESDSEHIPRIGTSA